MKISIKVLGVWMDEKYCMEAVKQSGYALRYVGKAFWVLFREMIDGM